MIGIDKIQERLKEIPCPICKQSRYTVDPRSKQSYAEMIYTARCAGCQYSFPVNVPSKPIHEVDPDLGHILSGTVCPSCEERGAELNFRCTSSVRDAYHFVTCKNCKHPFHEKAPMEAFE